MKEIKLTQGKVAMVDDEDFEELNQYKWCAYNDGVCWYAHRGYKDSIGKSKTEKMHRRILRAPNGVNVDHISGDGLDNRRENIRICTRSINRQNQHTVYGSSRYQGVHWATKDKKWRTQIKVNGKHIHIGDYISEGMAAVAYNIAALRFIGLDAKLNEV